ncbi:sugar ABC transporter permease protein [Mycoplasmopsis columbina SF7]|uniref:Sugar ABC transporter permease protein n=1 Tax=Mycoplasmopsis columbina SF7 TaxID=1037410 RepID=F9UKL6_9BACT|nr:ABC transporter permease [Mycoplasmopsis columbina]EGV00221.1 sugar ABC transporter permease protein [Mycoplasmopsis columbina SF7]
MLAFASTYNFAILFFCILSVGAIAGMFTEKVGIVNISINGMMIFGALGYLLISHAANKAQLGAGANIALSLVATVIGLLFGAVTSLLFGYATIKLKSSQTISGFAFNLLATGIALVFMGTFGDAKKLNNSFQNLAFSPTVTSTSSGQTLSYSFEVISLQIVLTILVIVLGYLALYKTKWGLRFRSIGENPQAADVAGVNVTKYKWQGVIISGILASLAGTFFAQATNNQTFLFNGDVAGLGYVALAIMIVGQWNILIIALASIIFSIFLGFSYSTPYINSLKKASDVLLIFPYLLTLIVVIFMSKRSNAPAAAGIPYDKSQR